MGIKEKLKKVLQVGVLTLSAYLGMSIPVHSAQIEDVIDSLKDINIGDYQVSSDDSYLDALGKYFYNGSRLINDSSIENMNKMDFYLLSNMAFTAIAGKKSGLGRNFTYDDYRNLVNKYASIVESDPGLNGSDGDKILTGLVAGVVAGFSVGYIPQPNFNVQKANLPQGYDLYYLYRVNQQALREGVLLGYVKKVLRLKEETQTLMDYVDDFCQTADEKPDYDFPPDDTPDKIHVVCRCHCSCAGSCYSNVEGEFHYRPITSSLEKMTEILVEQERETRKILCLNYLSKLETLKAEVQQAELELFNLSATYGGLENNEKATYGF